MKRQKTKEQIQLIRKMNAYIIPIFGIFFLYLAIEQRTKSETAAILMLIALFLMGYGFFRIMLFKKLMKDIDGLNDEELESLQKGEDVED